MRGWMWAGAAVLAIAAAIPLWLVLGDDGGERPAALTRTSQSALDCTSVKTAGCPELNGLLADLDLELQGSQRPAAIDAYQTGIRRNTVYQAAREEAELDSLNELSDEQVLALQQALERQAQLMATLSNLSKTYYDTQQTIITNIKG